MRESTIVAIATAPGKGAIGIVRLSGSKALSTARSFFSPIHQTSQIIPYRPILGNFISSQSKIDQVLFIYYPAPHSYTGEDVVEIHAHGSPVILRAMVACFLEAGCLMAEPGEFTKRAFLNGKIDLTQAEAVANLIAAKTELAAQASLAQLEGSLSRQVEQLRQEIVQMFVYVEAALDYPEEDIELLSLGELEKRGDHLISQIQKMRQAVRYGKLLQDGIQVVIVGKPNVGKSSLLNALLNEDRAIVTAVPGTTRDIISEYANLEGIPVKYIDTAGIREADGEVELEGIRRSRKSIEEADLILFVCDGASAWNEEDVRIFDLVKNKNVIHVINKADLMNLKDAPSMGSPSENVKIVISAKERTGLQELRQTLLQRVSHDNDFFSSQYFMINLRHEEALKQAEAALQRTRESLTQGYSGEFVAIDLREALDHLGEIVGKTTSDDILHKIFSTFCIGK